MSIRLFADSTGCAIYDEAPGGGDPLLPGALMNRPFLNPMSWVDNILFHSSFNYYGVVKSGSVTIAHPAVPGLTTARPYTPVILYGQTVARDYLLLQHNLGYVPKFFCAYAGQMIPHGTPIQVASGGGRLVSAYATSTQIRLRELGISTNVALPAVSKSYQILVFQDNAPVPALPQFEIAPGVATFGKGKFRMAQSHLRTAISGDTPFSIALGRTAAIRNGSLRVITPNGSVIDVGEFTGSLPTPAVVNLTTGQ